MTTSNNICLYANGLFGRNDDKVNAAQCAALQESGFTTVIIWALHVNQQGNLQFADDPVVRDGVLSSQYLYMGNWINKLKSSGSVNRVLISLGGWGVGDFSNMTHLLKTTQGKHELTQNFQAMVTALPIDGFDFDMEEWDNPGITNKEYVNTIATLTSMLSGMGGGMTITYCPYNHQAHWLTALEQVYAKANGRQLVSAYNLQCYAGGTGNEPSAWAETLQSAKTTTGISAPAAFIIPGFGCYNAADSSGLCPSDVQTTFAQLANSTPGITGGFIWNSGNIFSSENSNGCNGSPMTASAYATAMGKGLNDG
ncbi:glycosyl hydrolase family 18 protein [Undibacterium sp. TS12]|uniref:glycosyl hydrolase family 18 protein n=1 Tax=Undibacterium sp. TS12 TaxID=2908202 RepID=UPI001F4C59C4|nr:glycosyl hydrolase family 18 protein [Undibacterium sp. TS12]MCH8617517.1 glycosyl hydrolase family 18 protein [Undibacterium sp. TS12]